MVRINECIAMWERSYVFGLESGIGLERPNHTKFSRQVATRYGGCMSMQLDATNAGCFGELVNFCRIGIDENADGADSRR